MDTATNYLKELQITKRKEESRKMTYQGLEYLKHRETVRHNLAQENISQQGVNETVRSNLVREAQNWTTIGETMRHNQRTEDLGFQQLSENIRHNKVYETLEGKKLSETVRHNQAQERLTAIDVANKATSISLSNQQFYDKLEQDKEIAAAKIKLEAEKTYFEELPTATKHAMAKDVFNVNGFLANFAADLSGAIDWAGNIFHLGVKL